MNRDEAKECIKNNYRFYFEQHLSEYEKSKKGYPLCPKCKEHEIQPMKEKEGYYKCFKCGAYGDVLDYIRLEYGLKNFKEQMDKAIKLYKITIDKKSKIKGTKNLYMEPKQDIDIKNKQKASYTKYYEKISKNIDTTNYLLNRGISLKVQEEFGIRFDPKWTHPNDSYKTTQSMIIIPTGTDNTSYIARSIDIDSKEDHIYKVENSLFNSVALKSDKYNPIPVFITEGEIDALSILECKFKAVGLSSTVNKNLLISKLENMLSNEQCIPQLILYLDNDPSGKEASENLEKKLEALKIPCTNFYKLIEEHKKEYKNDRNYKEESEYLETLLKTKDPNDALKNNKDKFEQALLYAYTTTKFNYNKFFKKVYKDAKIEIEKMDPSDEKKEVLEYIKSSITKPALATGFYKLDEILNGGLKGGCLYGIGSVPSLGKTTLIMQIADYIAEHNRRNVCIFSLEMSKNDLMLKSIVRETYKKSSMSELTKSVSEIFKINNDDEYNKLTEDEYFKEGLNHYFNEINPYIYISEGIGDIDIKKVNERIKYFADNKPNDELPMIIIDYVQILSPYITDDNFKTKYITDKQILDKNIMELKRIARDKNIPIIAISSFNRDSYESETNFKSFKESGAIEYSSDVIIGLQLKMDRSKKLSEDEKLKQINKSKNKNPREVELVILKNRFGKAYKQISFKYYPQHDFFEENEKTEKLCSGQEIFIKKRGRVRSLYEKE